MAQYETSQLKEERHFTVIELASGEKKYETEGQAAHKAYWYAKQHPKTTFAVVQVFGTFRCPVEPPYERLRRPDNAPPHALD